jgi:tripartite-type tricarboxylate transporter receptor subunit TctC
MEAGLPSYSYDSWFGVMAPAGTPRPVIDKVNADIRSVLNDAAIQAQLTKQGVALALNSPDEFNKIIAEDTVRLTKVFADAAPK